MTGTVIDKRSSSSRNRLAGSRKKFIEKYKQQIKKQVDKHILNKKIKDLAKDSDYEIGIEDNNMQEKRAAYNRKKGLFRRVYSGNDKYNEGDIIIRDSSGGRGSGNGAGNSDEISEDDFSFVLTKEEFLNILFENMKLPNFLKKSNKHMSKKSYVLGGYVKEGIPARLAIKKSLENAAARRIASGKPREKCRFIDDIDLRYRNLIPEDKPISSAVVFFVMDVSGSMSQDHKLIAKKFFLLLYLFLNKNYQSVVIRFIRHHTLAKEVCEQDFFYGRETGGTIVSSAFKLVNEIIDSEYNVNEINIYIAQVSDGDNWHEDEAPLYYEIEKLLPKIQYFAYAEVNLYETDIYKDFGLQAYYKQLFSKYKKFATTYVRKESDVLGALHEIFKEEDHYE